MKKLCKSLILCAIVLPFVIGLCACGKTSEPADSGDSSGSAESVSSMTVEGISEEFETRYNSDTKTFTIEYSDPLPDENDFEITATYSNGTTKDLEVDDFRILCPGIYYESQGKLPVRNEPYEFVIIKDEETYTFYVKITKKKVAAVSADINEVYVYSGVEKELKLVGFDAAIMNISGNKAVNAGDYEASVSLKDTANYEWANGSHGGISWNISKCELNLPVIDGDYVYNKHQQEVSVNLSGASSELFEISGNKATNAGTHTVRVKIKDTANYKWKGVQGEYIDLSWNISKLALNRLAASGSYTYNTAEQTLDIDYKGYSSTLFSVVGHKAADAGEHTARVTLSDTTNYSWKDTAENYIDLTWSIAKLELNKLVVSGSYVYSGAEQTADIDYGSLNSTYFEVTNNKRTNAGTQTVNVKIKDVVNYSWKGEQSDTIGISWTIAKYKLDTLSISGTYTYSGSQQTVDIDYGSYNANLFTKTGNTGINAGGYTATITLNDTLNYEWKDVAENYIELNWSIAKLPVQNNEFPAIVGTYSYTGEEQSVVLDSRLDNTFMTVEGGSQTFAGTYEVKIKLDNNHCFADSVWAAHNYYILNWTIAKAQLDNLAVSGSYTYNKTAQNAIINYKGYASSLFTLSNETSGTNAGAYSIRATINDFANYKWASTENNYIDFSWSIGRKPVKNSELPSLLDADGYEYSGVKIEASLSNVDNEVMTITGNSQTSAGTHTITVTLKSNYMFEDALLESAGCYQIEWTIKEQARQVTIVDFSSYDIGDWKGTYNTKGDNRTEKEIWLEDLPDQVLVSYRHISTDTGVAPIDFIGTGTIKTTAIIVLNSTFANDYELPTSADVQYLPKVTNSHYEKVEVVRGTIEITFTWRIYSAIVDITTKGDWNCQAEYDYNGSAITPTIEYSEGNERYYTNFSLYYTYYKIDEGTGDEVKINGAPIERGEYRVSVEAVPNSKVGTSTQFEDCTFIIK